MFYDFVLEARYVAILFRFVSLLMEGCGVASFNKHSPMGGKKNRVGGERALCLQRVWGFSRVVALRAQTA